MMHSGQERIHPLNIEYVHISACMGYIQDIFMEALLSHPHLSLRRKLALVRAVNKILWIQNDLFAKWRVRDGEEWADEMSIYSFASSREGYVGDKKILGNSSGSSEDDRSSITSAAPSTAQSVAPSTQTADSSRTGQSGNVKASACPFAEFAKGQSMETKIWAGGK